MGPQPSLVWEPPIFYLPLACVKFDNCPSSGMPALLPADHPGKRMQLQGLQCICPTLTILVADGSFPIVYSELRRHPHTQQTHAVTAPKDRSFSLQLSHQLPPAKNPGRPSPPCRQPRALCRSLLCWRVCGAPASFTAALAAPTPSRGHSTTQPRSPQTWPLFLPWGQERESWFASREDKMRSEAKGGFSKVQDVIHEPFLALL